MMNDKNYLIVKHKVNKDWFFDMESENLSYADFDYMYGLQCNFMGDEPEYNEIMIRCKEIAKLIKEIDRINNPSDYIS
jgi:hypothetical protein